MAHTIITFCKRTFASKTMSCLAAVALVVIVGCGEDEYKGVKRETLGQPVSGIDTSRPTPGMETVYGDGGTPRTAIEGIGGQSTPLGNDQNRIRIGKADIYYKFEWARQILEDGIIPSDLAQVVATARTKVVDLGSGPDINLINEITELLEQGVDIEKAEADKSDQLNEKRRDPKANVIRAKKARKRFEDTDSFPDRTETAEAGATRALDHSTDDKWTVLRKACRKTIELGRMLHLAQDSQISDLKGITDSNPADFKSPFVDPYEGLVPNSQQPLRR